MSVRKAVHDAVAGQLELQSVYTMVDMWKAQITPTKNKFAPGFPAAFVSIKNIKWEDMTLDQKQGNVAIQIYLFFDKYGDTFEKATDKEKSFEIMDMMEESSEKIHWLQENIFSELTQTGEEDLTEQYGRPVYRLTFETLVYKQIRENIHVDH